MSSASGLIVQSSRHEAALERLLSTSKKTALEVCKQEFGIVLTTVAKYTPPASAGVTGLRAEKQGKARVAADIRALYGSPGDAYEAIEETSPAMASAYWLMHKSGDDNEAARLVRFATGKTFSPFDGGTLHQRMAPQRRRARVRKLHLFYVRNMQSLESYIQQEESHVWWLASGWAPALRALGRKLPYGVGKANAPGDFKVVINDRQIALTAIDSVPWASNVKDIERRLQWASNMRADALQRAWDFNLQRLAGEAGMKKA